MWVHSYNLDLLYLGHLPIPTTSSVILSRSLPVANLKLVPHLPKLRNPLLASFVDGISSYQFHLCYGVLYIFICTKLMCKSTPGLAVPMPTLLFAASTYSVWYPLQYCRYCLGIFQINCCGYTTADSSIYISLYLRILTLLIYNIIHLCHGYCILRHC